MGRLFVTISWIPLAVFVATAIYVRQFDGWGAWAAAQLFLFPLAMSFGFGIYGIAVCWRARKADELTWRLGLATLFALGPSWWWLSGMCFVKFIATPSEINDE